MKALECYKWCRDNYEDNEIIEWEDFSTDMDLDIPLDEGSREWVGYVQKRNQVRSAVNDYARVRGQNWRIMSFVHGKSIKKSTAGILIDEDVPARLKRIAQHVGAARKEWESLKNIDSIAKKPKAYLESMLNVITGALLFISGAIKNTELPKKVKEQLQNNLDL